MNVLILGIDSGDLGRDTVGQGTQEKLNAAYSYGGEETDLKTVENLLSIEIPYYISINLKGFKDVLAIVGPIKVSNSFSFR